MNGRRNIFTQEHNHNQQQQQQQNLNLQSRNVRTRRTSEQSKYHHTCSLALDRRTTRGGHARIRQVSARCYDSHRRAESLHTLDVPTRFYCAELVDINKEVR